MAPDLENGRSPGSTGAAVHTPRFPVPPGVVTKVVRSAADPETSVADLARILEMDPVLTSQVLKTVNSASFGLRSKVASVDRAVGFMGIRAVRNLVLSLGVRDLVPTTKLGAFPLDAYWEGSLRRAAAARCLAEQLELGNHEEFFTLGLCQDIGLLLRIGEDEPLGARLKEVIDEPADRRLELEQLTGEGHDELGFLMFTDWLFPDELALPMRFHHRPEEAPEAHRQAARVAHAAEALADLSRAGDTKATMVEAVSRMARLDLDVALIGPTIERINELVDEFADVLGMDVGESPSLDEIIAMASAGLATLNTSYEEMTRKLEQALAEQQRMASELQALNQKLDEQAHTDELTGLPNRRAFDEALAREVAVTQRQQSCLSLVMLDIDHFKRLNDTHGHPAGDHALAEVGRTLREIARRTDFPARIGGEEFAFILPFTDGAGGRIAAERLREVVESAAITWNGQNLSVTVSVGGATIDQVERATPEVGEALTRRADAALYEAKGSGRNRSCWDREAPPGAGAPA